jgi:protein-L-isoaspartate(D-aspartate) O-methyltransferase
MTLDVSAARLNMIDSQVRANDVPDLNVQAAMARAPRERFCPQGRAYLAYADCEVEYAPGWRLLTPRDIAKLLFASAPKPGEEALCLAAPYAAMVLADIGLKVTLRAPAGPARTCAEAALAPRDVVMDTADLKAGPTTPFDLMIVEGAVTKTPPAWLDGLVRFGRPGARLAVIERQGPIGKAVIYLRSDDGKVGRRDVFDATPTILPGFETQSTFAF